MVNSEGCSKNFEVGIEWRLGQCQERLTVLDIGYMSRVYTGMKFEISKTRTDRNAQN